ncbi:MAG: GerMN domain-containing protein [Gemmatimonadota bacterium]|nr:GerMN domain-containing protein [Gemmatimonadota bacterium]
MRIAPRSVILVGYTLSLVSACVREPPARDESAASKTATPKDHITRGPAGAVPANASGTPSSLGWPKQSQLERQALAVAVFPASNPSTCNLGAPRPEGSGANVVYFGCAPRQGPTVPAVPARIVRLASGSEPMEVALRALLGGPTDSESRVGYISSFSVASAGVSFRVARIANGLAAVDFDRAILDISAPPSDPVQNPRHLFVANMDAYQIVATLGQFSGVRRVTILVGGEPLCRARGEC